MHQLYSALLGTALQGHLQRRAALPIRSVDDLLKVADVVSEGIEIFRNSTGTEAKKAWLSNDKKAGSVGKKRKRAQ